MSSRTNFNHNSRDFRFISVLSNNVSLINNSISLRENKDFLLPLGIYHHHPHHLSHLTSVIPLFFFILIPCLVMHLHSHMHLTLGCFDSIIFLDALVICFIYVGCLINNYWVVFYFSMIECNFNDEGREEVTCILKLLKCLWHFMRYLRGVYKCYKSCTQGE